MKVKGRQFHKEVVWSARYILDKADGRELHSEQKLSVMRDGEELTFGSIDAYFKTPTGGELFDLKTGMERDYDAQIAAYALAIMQKYGGEEVKCHIIYSKSRKVEVKSISLEEAENTVYSIVDSVNDITRSPWLCDYCRWCKREKDCTAVKNFGYSIGGQIDLMWQINLDEPLDPAVEQRLLSIVGTVERWASSVREKVKNK